MTREVHAPKGRYSDHHKHQLKGKLKGFWEYEVDGGARVRYKRGTDDRVVVLVVDAGPAPSDTH
ncbi:MAG TPA: hypothetical protein VNR42_10670 [Solirubrobacteraceae bacterium]|nr:hypothetical protein [Solirubrobacteraceae bacterium]